MQRPHARRIDAAHATRIDAQGRPAPLPDSAERKGARRTRCCTTQVLQYPTGEDARGAVVSECAEEAKRDGEMAEETRGEKRRAKRMAGMRAQREAKAVKRTPEEKYRE